MQINDFVIIKNEDARCIYKITKIITDNNEEICFLHGVYYRIARCEKSSNLIIVSTDDINKEEAKEKVYLHNIIKKNERSVRQKYVLGKILHLDGDVEYLNKCLDLYKELGIYAFGRCVKEESMASEIGEYIRKVNPDVVVITGHDIYNNKGIKDLANYANTLNFMKTIKKVREVKQNSCVVIAGACQSNYEALIASGADFASSPKRINVHTYDPAIIAIKASITSFTKLINSDELFEYIENGKDAFNGLQTFGKMRLMF